MQCDERAPAPLSSLLKQGGSGGRLHHPRALPASWKPWHESTRCRPDYVSQESCLNPGAGLGVLGISAPGDGGRGLLSLTSFLLDQHIPNGQLLVATCMYCSGVDKKG